MGMGKYNPGGSQLCCLAWNRIFLLYHSTAQCLNLLTPAPPHTHPVTILLMMWSPLGIKDQDSGSSQQEAKLSHRAIMILLHLDSVTLSPCKGSKRGGKCTGNKRRT